MKNHHRRFPAGAFRAMNWENQLLVIDEQVEFEKQLVKVQDFQRTFPIILEESMKYISM
jgi:hypothetical protein